MNGSNKIREREREKKKSCCVCSSDQFWGDPLEGHLPGHVPPDHPAAGRDSMNPVEARGVESCMGEGVCVVGINTRKLRIRCEQQCCLLEVPGET